MMAYPAVACTVHIFILIRNIKYCHEVLPVLVQTAVVLV